MLYIYLIYPSATNPRGLEEDRKPVTCQKASPPPICHDDLFPGRFENLTQFWHLWLWRVGGSMGLEFHAYG